MQCVYNMCVCVCVCVCVLEKDRDREIYIVFDVSKPSVLFIKVLSRSCVLMIK